MKRRKNYRAPRIALQEFILESNVMSPEALTTYDQYGVEVNDADEGEGWFD